MPQGNLKTYRLEMLRAFPHEGAPFTQGLEISDDGMHLVESSGSYPPGTSSFIRIVDPLTGKTVRKFAEGLEGRFAEGIVQAGNGNWYMSTYLDEKLVEYSPDLKYVGEKKYPGMGWGLTRTTDGGSFLATNGSEYVMTLQKDTLDIADMKVVTCQGKKVPGLNELEMVDNFMDLGPTLLGNVYQTRLVLAVNPANGKCTGVFSLEGLGQAELNEAQGFHVANGLAYNKTSGTLIATGKNWDQMFEVSVHEDHTGAALPALERFLQHAPPAAPEQVGAIATQTFQVESKGASFAQVKRLSQIPEAEDP
jgi:glutamine cyclotransferase